MAMMEDDELSHDLNVNVLCSCCDGTHLGWEEFLGAFANVDVLPERRSPVLLRVSFRGKRGRSKAARADRGLRSVLTAQSRRGAARRVNGGFEMPGIVVRTCANGH
jgi:hypothetical protein